MPTMVAPVVVPALATLGLEPDPPAAGADFSVYPNLSNGQTHGFAHTVPL